ncbi:MAG TPA: mechanosensitive ion channel [Thermosynechococcaceae cyanobacterium]
MNELWQGLGHSSVSTLPSSVLAQAPQPAPQAANDPVGAAQGFLQGLGFSLGPVILNLVGALAILLVGWLVAAVVSSVVRGLLNKTDFDNKIAGWATGRPGAPGFDVEKWVSAVVFWIILILAVVAALNVLNLNTVSLPLNNFLNQIFAFLPRLGAAAIWIGVAWLLATLAKTVVVRTARSFDLDRRLAQEPAGRATDAPGRAADPPFLLSETLGSALYWFVFLFFLPLILGVLDLQGPLQPVQNLLNDILAALPRILKAVVIGAVGWLVAKVVRGIVTNLLSAIGADQVGSRIGLSRTAGSQSLSWLIGTIVYVLILIPTATAALDALQVPSISDPAKLMLSQILSAIPQIFTAVLILAASFVLGKFVSELVSSFLSGIGFNNVFQWLGIQSSPYTPPAPSAPYPPAGEPTFVQESDLVKLPSARSPSEIAGLVVLVGIVLFGTVAATNVLNIPALTAIVSGLLVISGQILVGLAIFAVGLYLANLAYSLISSSGSAQAKLLAQTARISIIALVAAMALQQAGIAPNIVNLAFGLLLGAIAVAIALAFGLGGRDVAAEQLREWLEGFKRKY